jgi:transcriptional regulator with XRE-family HTH domain
MSGRNVAALQAAAEDAGRDILNRQDGKPDPRAPDTWDVHVGRRLREGRRLRGLTQAALAEAVDVSFQQVQKYENGRNRISASKLVRFAKALKVAPAWFYEGEGGLTGTNEDEGPRLEGLSRADLAVARDIARLPPELRRRIEGLIRALVEGAGLEGGRSSD